VVPVQYQNTPLPDGKKGWQVSLTQPGGGFGVLLGVIGCYWCGAPITPNKTPKYLPCLCSYLLLYNESGAQPEESIQTRGLSDDWYSI
jgi:hypothetical protein